MTRIYSFEKIIKVNLESWCLELDYGERQLYCSHNISDKSIHGHIIITAPQGNLLKSSSVASPAAFNLDVIETTDFTCFRHSLYPNPHAYPSSDHPPLIPLLFSTSSWRNTPHHTPPHTFNYSISMYIYYSMDMSVHIFHPPSLFCRAILYE